MDTLVVAIADWLVIPVVLVSVASLLYFVPNKKKIPAYSRLLVAGLTSYMTAKFMALAYQPSSMRPFEIAGVAPGASYLDNPGFPSDHALFVWVLVFAVWHATRKTWLVLAVITAAIMVSIGRVVALVHAPVDIVGGFFAAAVGAVWYMSIKGNQTNTLQKQQK